MQEDLLQHPAFIANARLKHALATAADRFRGSKSAWRPVEGLVSWSDAFGRRIEQVAARMSARVDYDRTLRRYMKETAPGFVLCERFDENHRFRKETANGSAVLIGFDKMHFHGLGKAFQVNVGLEAYGGWLGRPTTALRPVTEWVGLGHRDTWVYFSKEELVECLENATALLLPVASGLEKAALEFLSDSQRELPDPFQIRGPIQARQAWPEASETGLAWNSDAMPVIAASHGLSPDGTLRPQASWNFLFLSASTGCGLWVTVPFAGELSTRTIRTPESFTHHRIDPQWMDSVRAFALAEEHGGRLARDGAGAVDYSYTLEYDPIRYGLYHPRCAVRYIIHPPDGGRRDFQALINPVTWKVV